MGKKRNLFSVMIAMLLVIVMLAACSGNNNAPSAPSNTPAAGGNSGGSGSNNSGSGEGEKKEDITLRIAWWGSQGRHDATIQVLKMYEELNPHITFEYEFGSSSGYWQKMAAQAAGNNMPDILQQNMGEYLTQYSQQNLLADLTEFVENGTINTTNIDPAVIDSGKLGGGLYGISLGTNALTIIYDPALVEQAGGKLPELGWTWDDLTETAKQVAGVARYGVNNLETYRIFEYYLRQHGFKLYNEDGTALGYDDDQLLADFLAMKLDWVKSGAAPTLDVASQHQDDENTLLVHGSLAFHFDWSNKIVSQSEAGKREMRMAILPGPDTDQGMYLRPSQFFSISENSVHKEEAAKFIDFFTNNIEANKILAAERGVPISSEVRNAIKPGLPEAVQQSFDYIELVAENSSLIDKNHPLAAAQVTDLLTDLDERVLYERITPEDAAKEFRTKATELLNKPQ